MEIDEKISLLKLNYALSYSNTDWIIDIIKKYRKASLLFERDNELIYEAELLRERFNKVIDIAKKFDAEKELKECEKKSIEVITYFDENYPQELKDISNPPLVIYLRGRIKKMTSISIVGTRHPTDYGIKHCKEISYDLANVGVRVVSGLARGIDTIAHKWAIKAKGITIAVIGSGMELVYPPENRELAEKIVESGGCVISEYPLHTKPLKNNFPRRNRIISALSFATLVIEGDYNSGALITARYALEQGKDVMALCGSVDWRFSNGPNKLIKEGAYLIRNAKDVVELIPPSELFGIDLNKIYEEKTKEINLTQGALKIYEFIKANKEATIDQISGSLNITLNELFGYIFELETSGVIVQFAGKYKIRE